MIDREKLMRNAAANFEDSGRPRIKVSAFGEVTIAELPYSATPDQLIRAVNECVDKLLPLVQRKLEKVLA